MRKHFFNQEQQKRTKLQQKCWINYNKSILNLTLDFQEVSGEGL